MEGIHIREANIEDCDQIADLIKELAVYLECPDRPQLDSRALRRDGFGEEKLFLCLVAEDTKATVSTLVGHAMYFFQYSAWEGRCVFLDELYVKPAYRGAGTGSGLWREVAKIAIAKGCCRMDWLCLKANSSSIAYYKRQGGVNVTEDEGWCVFRLRRAELDAFAEGKQN